MEDTPGTYIHSPFGTDTVALWLWVVVPSLYNLSCAFFFSSLNASSLAGLPAALLNIRHKPFQRGFFCSDDSLKYPFKEDTISYQLLGGVMIPVVIITVSASALFSAKSTFFTSF